MSNSNGDRDTEYTTTYAYMVDGSNLTATTTSKSFTQSGAKIDIKYNPDNPSKTFISSGPTALLWIFPGIGLLLVVFAAFKLLTFKKGAAEAMPQSSINPIMPSGALVNPHPTIISQQNAPTTPAQAQPNSQQPPFPPNQAP